MTSIHVTWWEFDELLEHLRGRPDIWTQSEENEFLWLRGQTLWSSDGDAKTISGCAFSCCPPIDATSPFRLFQIDIIPLEWEEAYCQEYLRRTLECWTTYGQRKRVETFLVEELQVSTEHAMLGAIGLGAQDYAEERVDPDSVSGPEQQSRLWPDSLPPLSLTPLPDPLDVGTWLLQGGGYVSLRLQAEMLRVSISIKDNKADGYGPPLRGYVRPPSGNILDFIRSVTKRKDLEDETPDRNQPVLVEGLPQLQEAVCLEEAGEPGASRQEERP